MLSTSFSQLLGQVGAFMSVGAGQSSDLSEFLPTIPPELIDKVIDQLCNDSKTLLAIGLASKQTLVRSRLHLFSTITFDDQDGQFDAFLSLVDKRWTSFASVVETLHLKDLFHVTRRYKYRHLDTVQRLTIRLPKLTTIWLSSVSWRVMPTPIRQLLCNDGIIDLQLDRVEFSGSDDTEAVEFFSILPPNDSRSISLHDIQYDEVPQFQAKPDIFRHPLRFKSLDTTSLVFLSNALDTSFKGLSAESFYLRLPALTSRERQEYHPFISNFLRHVGPSLDRLSCELSRPFFEPEALPLYQSLDYSQCTSLRAVHIGEITQDDASSNETKSTMWTILSGLPANSIETVSISMLVSTETDEHRTEVEYITEPDFAHRLRTRFPRLKKITVRILRVSGWFSTASEPATCFQIEKQGVVSSQTMLVRPSCAGLEPYWRDTTW